MHGRLIPSHSLHLLLQVHLLCHTAQQQSASADGCWGSAIFKVIIKPKKKRGDLECQCGKEQEGTKSSKISPRSRLILYFKPRS